MLCENRGSTRWFYTGNQVGWFNHTGLYDFVAGGPPGSGISASRIASLFFQDSPERAIWETDIAKFDQETLDASYPFINMNWIADIHFDNNVFRVSDKNIYAEDENGVPRFYEARVQGGPSLSWTLGEWLNPNYEIGDITLRINNRDGAFNSYLAQGENYVAWTGTKVVIKVGFGEKYSNYFTVFTGYVADKKGIESTDEEITLKCYDQTTADEVALPAQIFDEAGWPQVEDTYKGKPVPYVYGDWMNEVDTYGSLPAICINAKEEDPEYYTFLIAGNPLLQIGDIYLTRGNRKKDGEGPPIKLVDSIVIKDEANGRFIVPKVLPVLTDPYDIIPKDTAGPGSGLNVINSSGNTDFVEKGVSIGDKVVKRSTSEDAVVIGVTVGQLSLAGDVTFTEKDEYYVSTNQYIYTKNDKLSVKCFGKNIRNLSTNRLADAGLGSSTPVCLSLALNGTYWFADNVAKKVYELNFANQVVSQITFTELAQADSPLPEPTYISGLVFQVDETLWFYDQPTSRMYRYDFNEKKTVLSFTMDTVTGLGRTLVRGLGLSIDENNYLYIVENSTGTFFKIDPFTPFHPTVLASWNSSAFDPLAIDISDTSADINNHNLIVVDRVTLKLYRINMTTGALVSSFALSEISPSIAYPSGCSYSQDGTVFVLDATTMALYNYNESTDANTNPGFIARDVLQRFTGKLPDNFDLKWNECCRKDMSKFKMRLYMNEKTTIVTYLSKTLQQFNTSMYIRFGRYALFHYTFDNFLNDGKIIREGDIKLNSFNPSKEYNQYFNSAYAEYGKDPFNNDKVVSETYISLSGITSSGKEVQRKLDMPAVYRREDVDTLLPLFVRLSSAEPEFVNLTVGFKRLFAQLNDFYRINFVAPPDKETGIIKSGRRFEMVPCFVRKMEFDLSDMSIKLKVWSLGATAFGDFVPKGKIAGGSGDKIVLTGLGTIGYVSPVGTILSATNQTVVIADVGGENAETRHDDRVGLAWEPGMKVAIVDGATHEILARGLIQAVTGGTIFLQDMLPIVPSASTMNSAGFIVGGNYLRYDNYDTTTENQKKKYAHFGKPLSAYPVTTAAEIEEQRAGTHNFADGRIPYLLHPKDYTGADL